MPVRTGEGPSMAEVGKSITSAAAEKEAPATVTVTRQRVTWTRVTSSTTGGTVVGACNLHAADVDLADAVEECGDGEEIGSAWSQRHSMETTIATTTITATLATATLATATLATTTIATTTIATTTIATTTITATETRLAVTPSALVPGIERSVRRRHVSRRLHARGCSYRRSLTILKLTRHHAVVGHPLNRYGDTHT